MAYERKQTTDWVECMKNLRRATDDSFGRYEENYYRGFFPNSGHETIFTWIKDNFSTHIGDVLKSRFLPDEQISLLGIGSGRGAHEIEIIKKLSTTFSRVSCVAVDPSPSGEKMHDAFSRDAELRDVIFYWHQNDFNHFLQNKQSGEKYHVITVIYSLYFVADALEHILSSLVEGGLLIITLGSGSGGYFKMMSEKPWLSVHQHKITSKEVREATERGNCSVTTVVLPVQINITPVLDEQSELGNEMLDLMTFTYNFRECAPKDIQADFFEFLRSPAVSTTTEDGSTYVENNQELMIIQKN